MIVEQVFADSFATSVLLGVGVLLVFSKVHRGRRVRGWQNMSCD